MLDQVIQEARRALRSGAKRDDVYHGIVRYAAQHKLDRYSLWQAVVSPHQDEAAIEACRTFGGH